MAAAEMEDGRTTGSYDLAMIERQLSRTGTAAPLRGDKGEASVSDTRLADDGAFLISGPTLRLHRAASDTGPGPPRPVGQETSTKETPSA
jgi:hypothetical protein